MDDSSECAASLSVCSSPRLSRLVVCVRPLAAKKGRERRCVRGRAPLVAGSNVQQLYLCEQARSRPSASPRVEYSMAGEWSVRCLGGKWRLVAAKLDLQGLSSLAEDSIYRLARRSASLDGRGVCPGSSALISSCSVGLVRTYVGSLPDSRPAADI